MRSSPSTHALILIFGERLRPVRSPPSPAALPISATYAAGCLVTKEPPPQDTFSHSFSSQPGTVAATLFLAVLAAYAFDGPDQIRRMVRRSSTVLTVSMFPQVAVLSGHVRADPGARGSGTTLPSLMLSYLTLTLPFSIWALYCLHARAAGRDRGGGDSGWGLAAGRCWTRILAPLIALGAGHQRACSP